MPNTPPNLIAYGNIRPARFVTVYTGADFAVLEGAANARVIGVAQEGSNYPPLNDLGLPVYAAQDGDPVQIYGDGDTCLLELGDTVTRGGRLKSDSVGRGVPIATTGTTIQQIGAVALQSGVVGNKIRVQVTAERSERPALT